MKQEEIGEGIDNILDDWFGSQLSKEKIIALRKILITFLYGKNVVINLPTGKSLEGCVLARLEPLIKEE